MPPRPLFDQNMPGSSAPVPSNSPSFRGNQGESPLASQLPAWDLIPAHTLLVRRRPGALNKPAPRSDTTDKALAAAPPPVPRAAAPAPTPAPVAPPPAPEAVPDRFCLSCGSQLEEGATFCTDCGHPVSSSAKATLTVFLTAAGASHINVIKAIRETTSLGLKEAKDVVDLAPQPVKQCASRQEAAAIVRKLVEAGATAEIR